MKGMIASISVFNQKYKYWQVTNSAKRRGAVTSWSAG